MPLSFIYTEFIFIRKHGGQAITLCTLYQKTKKGSRTSVNPHNFPSKESIPGDEHKGSVDVRILLATQ